MKTLFSIIIIIFFQNVNLTSQNVYFFEKSMSHDIKNFTFLDDICNELKSRKLQFYKSGIPLNIVCDSSSVLYGDFVITKNDPSQREGTFLKDGDIIFDFSFMEFDNKITYNCDIYIVKIFNGKYYLTIDYYNNEGFGSALIFNDNFNRNEYFERYNVYLNECVQFIKYSLKEIIKNCCYEP